MTSDEMTAIRRSLAQRSPGQFHLPEIWGGDWDALAIGDKVKTGRDFLEAVRRGEFAGVEDTGRKAGGGRLYLLRRA
ncbi:DUF1413 domain-containing protein [Aquicoccus sp. SCR17]|nr:DUF1413 domain-containing protein [Carideicomes alvinocaridis]